MSIHLVERVGPETTPEEYLGQALYFAKETRRVLTTAVAENARLTSPSILFRKVNFTAESANVNMPEANIDAYSIEVMAAHADKTPEPHLERIAKMVCSSRRFCIWVGPAKRHRRHQFNDEEFRDRLMLLAKFVAGKPVGLINRILYL